MAHAPTAMTILGSGTASQVLRRARRMFSEIAPVISRPSACRGDATNWIPKRLRSQATVFSTFTSSSHALQPPALTWRSLRERPKRLRSRPCSAPASSSSRSDRGIRSARVRTASRWSRLYWSAPSGHALTQSVQKMQRPISMPSPSRRSIARVGQASAHAAQPSGHLEASIRGRPRNRSGSDGGGPSGYARVRYPCRRRARITGIIERLLADADRESQVVPAVGEVEALVAQGEVGDLLTPQGVGQAGPVVEGGIHDLVAFEAAGSIRDRDVTELAPPSLHERHRDLVRRERPKRA